MLEKKIKLRNKLEELVFSEQFKKAKESNPDLEELEQWMENSEVGETSVEEYNSKLEMLSGLLGDEKGAGAEIEDLD